MSASVSAPCWLGFHGSVVNFEFGYLTTLALLFFSQDDLGHSGSFILHRLLCENNKEKQCILSGSGVKERGKACFLPVGFLM